MMKVFTENDIKDIAAETFGETSMISEALYKRYSEKLIRKLIDGVNKRFGTSVAPENIREISLNDIVERMNEEAGLNEYIVRDFFLEICRDNLQNTAIMFDGEEYTYAFLKDTVIHLAAALSETGVKKASKVALILSNRIEYILLYFALFYIGAYPVPVNTRWGKEEVYNILRDSAASVIVTEDKIGGMMYGEFIEEYVKERRKTEDACTVIYFDENRYGGCGIAYEVLISKAVQELVPEEILPDDVAMLSYTSGTTGMPKGVMLKQNDIVKISMYTTQTWRTEENEYPFSIAPLYSAQGFLSLFIDFAIGKTFKMSSSFNPNHILKEISKGENTIIHTQPTMWSLLLNCRIINFTRFDSLNKVVVSGSLCSPQLAKKIEDQLGCTLLNAYGLIESTSVVTMTRMDDPYDVRMNTVGRPVPGVKIKIVDEKRNEVQKGEIGELAVRGYNMLGYYNNDARTREIMDDEGWLYTGDLARYYDEENISIVGRCKEMIIRGGFNVYPSDIEEYLLQIDEVQNAAVVGKENEILGEEIVAFILPRAGSVLTKHDVIKALFKKLANYKMPDKVIFVSEIPTILAGKIDKKELKKWAKEGVPEAKKMLFS